MPPPFSGRLRFIVAAPINRNPDSATISIFLEGEIERNYFSVTVVLPPINGIHGAEVLQAERLYFVSLI
jgi:hypothetical protein